MFELLLAPKERTDYRVGQGPIGTYPTAARASHGLAISQNKIFYTGGSGSNAAYPSTGALMNINADGVVSGQTYPNTGYIGTWAVGREINGVPYMYVGHVGSYSNPTFLAYSFTSGTRVDTYTMSGLPYRSSPVFLPAGGNKAFWGLGAANGVIQRENYIIDLVAKTYVATTPYPAEYPWITVTTGGIVGTDGKYYIGLDDTCRLVHFDPVTNQWRRSRSCGRYFINGQLGAFYLSGIVAYDRYILLFERGQRPSSAGKLACLRYDTVNETFAMFEFPTVPCRYVTTPAIMGDRLYIASGGTGDGANIDASTKYTDIIVFDAKQFLD